MDLKVICGVLSSLTLAACTSAMDVPPEPFEYTPTTRLTPKSETVLLFRTNTKETGTKKEIGSIPCSLAGKGFKSRFTTPALVKTPEFGPDTKPVSVTCTYKKEKRSVKIAPYNRTLAELQQNKRNAAAGNGLIGLLVASAVVGYRKGARDPSKDVYGYAPSELTFGEK